MLLFRCVGARALPSHDDTYLSSSPTKGRIGGRKKMRKSRSFSDIPKSESDEQKEEPKCKAHSNNFHVRQRRLTTQQKIQTFLEEAASQQSIILQTSQALNLSLNRDEEKRGSPEVIEGERLLLLATEQRTVCLEQVEHLKSLPGNEVDSASTTNQMSSSAYSANEITPCTGDLILSDIRLPLRQEIYPELKAERAVNMGKYWFVVVVSCGTENVYATTAVSTGEHLHEPALLMSGSPIIIKNVHHDFVINVKVYVLHSKPNLTPPSKGRQRRTMSEEDFAFLTSPQTVFRTSNFKLIGDTKVNMVVIKAKNYLLSNVPSNCPLEGSIQMQISCEPRFMDGMSGFVTIQEDIGGYTTWNRRWCVLTDQKLFYWRYPDDQEDKLPLGEMDLRHAHCESVELLPLVTCARPNTFELLLRRPTRKHDRSSLISTIIEEFQEFQTKYWLSTDNKEERVKWITSLNQHLCDARAWAVQNTKTISPQPIDYRIPVQV